MAFIPLTALEEATLDHIGTLTDCEIHVYVTEDGDSMLDVTVNPAAGGHLSPKIASLLDSGQKVRLLHNHPSGGSLSDTDWPALARYFGMLEIVAVTPNGSIFRGKVEYDFQAVALKKLLVNIEDAYNHMSNMITVPNISMADPSLLVDAQRLPFAFISYRFYELGHVDYDQSLSYQDKRAMAGVQGQPIKRMWRDFLKKIWP
ncbi:hypothetical protein [Rhizobium ruizarguesonis]|jgi:hypothetical protein|uniref:hypothetical protein n=1 Tax=Rhizobium ruizarguesonis TaxID=2081791 RepID=UPI0010318675|nr:hypothetical protein [Rhizobium ruizarguesonis]TBA24718.1 hypothetical protein ELH61_02400 [Rhizobium ruizarguesonis]